LAPASPTSISRLSSPPTKKSQAKPDTKEQQRLNEQLIAAVWENDLRRASNLIARGADVNAKDNTVQSAYLISTSEGYLELLDLTLKHCADVDSKDSFNGTGLIRAADRGHADIAGRLIQADIKINHINNLGWTALHEAIILGDGSRRYVDTVRVLIAAGADLRLKSQRDQITPARYVSRGSRNVSPDSSTRYLKATRESLRFYVRAWKPTSRRSNKPSGACSLLPNAEMPRLPRSPSGREPALRPKTPAAVRRCCLRSPKITLPSRRLLVYLGADPDAFDDQHDTPWLVTGVTGSVDMLEVLLPARPDLSIRNRFGGTSLTPASERGHVAYVRRVVPTDIDVNHINNLGWTALLEAVILGDGSKRYQQIVTILLDAGADASIADREGITPLQHAQRRGQREVARILRNA